MRSRTFASGLVLAVLCVAVPAWTQTFTGGTKPYVLQGKLAADQAGAQQSGWFAVSLGTIGQPDTPVRWVGVTAFNTWDDDPFEGRQVLRRLMPDQPTLLLTGPSEMLAKLQRAPAGNKVVLRGMLVPESRNFMLSAVQVLPPDAKMPD
jgi:hypothetical protein